VLRALPLEIRPLEVGSPPRLIRALRLRAAAFALQDHNLLDLVRVCVPDLDAEDDDGHGLPVLLVAVAVAVAVARSRPCRRRAACFWVWRSSTRRRRRSRRRRADRWRSRASVSRAERPAWCQCQFRSCFPFPTYLPSLHIFSKSQFTFHKKSRPTASAPPPRTGQCSSSSLASGAKGRRAAMQGSGL
jgi:hypothetical protein